MYYFYFFLLSLFCLQFFFALFSISFCFTFAHDPFFCHNSSTDEVIFFRLHSFFSLFKINICLFQCNFYALRSFAFSSSETVFDKNLNTYFIFAVLVLPFSLSLSIYFALTKDIFWFPYKIARLKTYEKMGISSLYTQLTKRIHIDT